VYAQLRTVQTDLGGASFRVALRGLYDKAQTLGDPIDASLARHDIR